MGLAVNRAIFMRKVGRSLHFFLASVLAVSTLSAVSIVTAPSARALSNSDCTPTVSGVTASAVASGNDCIITFTAGSGTWTAPTGVTSYKVLVVGGGGGGGADAGGAGGGGGVFEGTIDLSTQSNRSFSITVGTGGLRIWHTAYDARYPTDSANNGGTNGSLSKIEITDSSSNLLAIQANGGNKGTFGGSVACCAAGGSGGSISLTDNSSSLGYSTITNTTGGTGGTGFNFASAGNGGNGSGGYSSSPNFTGAFGGGGGGGADIGTGTFTGGSGVNGGGVGGSGTDNVATRLSSSGATNTGGGGGAGSAHAPTGAITIGGVTDHSRNGAPGGSGVVMVRFTVPTLATPSTPDLDTASDTGQSSSDNYTNDSTPTFSGTATAGSTIQLYADGVATGSACTTNSSGNWNCTTGTLSHKSAAYSFTVTSTLGFGTTTTSSALSASVWVGNTAGPSITWSNGSGTLSNGQTAQISFATGRPIYSFTVEDITVTGGTISSFVEVSSRSFTAVFTPTANSSGTASITVDANKILDLAGNNNNASSALSIPYDTFTTCSPATTISGGFTILTFTSTSTCNWNVPSGVSSADVLVVGGGGGGAGTYSTGVGASGGAGGGGGAYLANAVPLTPSAKMQIKVGSGGSGGITTSNRPGSEGSQGGDSAFGTLTAGGGGGGGCATQSSNNVVCTNSSMAGRAGTAGGSGGGASPPWNAFNWGAAGTGSSVTIGGTTFAAQTGYIGAIYSASANSNTGGAGSGGGARSAATTSAVGSGLSTDIAGGSAVEYGRGGRGSNQSGTTFNATTSGYGNGGDGAVVASGAGAAGATGAQGVVIVKYLNAPSISLSTSTITASLGSAVSSYTITNSGGAASSYSISPAFSLAGLSWSSSTGLISGTPTEIKSAVTYTITATNSSGSSTTTFTLSSNYAACSPSSSSAGGYTILRFTTIGTCNWSIPAGIASADILVIGGGGAGGTRAGGGGGAGGYLYFPNQAVTANQSTNVTVGAGGVGVLADSANNGGDSSFGTLTVAKGGGGGGGAVTAGDTARSGKSGGSGGGAAGNNAGNASAAIGLGTTGQGFKGGSAAALNAWPGGGGGGSASDGFTPVSNTATAGKGGSGTLNSITGTSVCYATGGGAGTNVGYAAGPAGDCGGAASPNGGAGTVGSSTPAAPTANTGAGGGGSGWSSGGDSVGGNGASGIVIVRYVNGDAAAAAITTQPTGAASGSALATQPVIRIVDAAGNTVTSSTVSVVASIASGGGTLSGTTSVAAVNGVATFTNLLITGTSGDRTLTFTPTSLTAATSNSLTITAGAATKVAITRASSGTQRRTAFTTQPQITVQDASGNTVTSSSAVVTATVSDGGTLVGTTTATASSGVATFSGLGVDGTIGTTYTITYTVSGLTVATATVTLTATTCDGSFTCQVGDIGPGGGRIFYVAPTFFTQASASGSMCSTNCKYLEAAPTSGTSAWGSTTDSQHIWSGNTNTAIGTTARGTAVGTGYANTLAIVGQNSTSSRAATSSRDYRGPNNLTDWFLPSKDEFNQMCKWQKGITGSDLTNLSTVCTGSAMNTGVGAAGFTNAWAYWTSTERDATNAQYQYMSTGNQGWDAKSYNFYVRPVRAFGPAPTVISDAAIAGVTAPVAGATPVTTTTAGTGYTGTVTWSGSPTTFGTGTTYTATITLTAAAGYTLTGVTENFFTVSGATTDTNPANSGVITAVFPATASSTVATLSGLTLTTATLSPTFNSGTTSYTSSVVNGTTSITVTPTRTQANATITVNGTAVTSGSASGAISLNVGSNTITVVVTAQDGTTTATYTVNVTRAIGAVAPTIGTQPTAVAKTVGQSVTFTVAASKTDAGTLSYQWQKLISSTWTNIASATSSSYIFTATATSDAGDYRVVVTNTLSGTTATTTSNVVALTMSGALSITTPSGLGLQGNHNSAFSLTISASGGAGSNAFSATGSLPTGVTLSSSGVISGTPSTAGNFSLTVTVTDANGATATTSSFTIAIAKGVSTVSLTIPTFTFTGSPQGPDTVTKTGTTGNVTYAYAGRGSTTYASSATKPTNVGTYIVTATVAADDNFATVSASGNFEISKANQTAISSPVLSASSKTFPFSQSSLSVTSVTGGSGDGALSISSVVNGTATGCSLSGSTLSASTSGTCTLTITKGASANFEAATTTATFTFNQASQTVAITSIAPTAAKVAGSTYALTATGGASGNAITFTSTTTSVCTVATATVSFVGVGTCSIAANQASTTNYSAATEATQSFSVGKGDPTLSSFANVTKVISDSTFTLTAPTVGNSLVGAFTYSSGTAGTATISGTTVTIVAAGTSLITATFTPTDSTNYNTATITMILTVNRLYTISYDGNQSDGGTTPAASSSIAAGTTVTVASNISGFTRTGYTFVAWNTAADGSGTQYVASNTLTMPSADTTLFAQWTKIKTSGLIVNLDTTNPQSLGSGSTTWVNALPGSSVSSQTANGNITRTSPSGFPQLNFDGNADYYQYTTVTNTRITGAMSVEMWINPSTLTNGWNILATRWFSDTAGTAANDWHFALYPSGGTLKLNLYTTGLSNQSGSFAFTTGKWYLVGFTIDSSNNLQFYVNGKTDGNVIAGASHVANTSAQLWIGDGRANVGGFIGAISKFRLYSNALTSAEMLANFDAEYASYSHQKITFSANYGATPTTSTQYLYKSTSTALNANLFTRTGYTFAGWNTEANGSGTPYANSASVTLTNDTNLFAQWTGNSQTITYAAGTGGSGSGPTTPATVTYGGTFTTPANTFTRSGFTFAGWSDGTSVFQAGVTYPTTGTVSANVTLSATWTADTNAVVFNNNTGSGTMSNQNIVSSTATSLTSNTFTKTGYTFAGWNTNANGTSGTNYTDGQSVNITAGMTLYAKWSANALTVTYDSKSGTAVSNGTVNTGASISSAPTAPTRTGYTFSAWSATDGGTAITFPYAHGQTTNFTLYAIWTSNTLTVTYDSQGGTSVNAGSVATDAKISSAPTAPTKTGYTFSGWATTTTGSVVSFSGGYTHGQTASFTLYAIWAANALTITYDSKGGSPVADGTVNAGASISSAPTAPTKAGYSLSGWSATDGGTVVIFPYAHGQSANFTLYAIWSANALTITYDSKSGTSVSNGSVNTGANISAAPTAPTRTGYTFAGWSATDGGSAVSFPYAHGQTANFTLYAIWTANSLTVTYDSKGGTAVSSGSVYTGASISSAPTAPTRTGYTFSAWSATDGGTAITFPYAHGQTANFTLFALWTAGSLVITYDSKGGTSVSNGSTSSGASISSAPTAPTRTGYTFDGWSVTETGTVVVFPYAHGRTANFTLYAKWTGTTNTITYDSKSGSSVANGSFVTGGSIASAPTAPTRAGYSLTGWSLTDGGSVITYPYSPVATSGITLYAIWAAISCSPTSTTTGGYTIYSFTTVGTCFWTVPNGVTDVEILAVAGGGGGGYAWDNTGGGGGAGGQVKTGTATLSTTLEVTVGSGGTAGVLSSTRGGSGGSTVVSTLTALGGTGGCAARATTCSNSAQATSLAAANGGVGGSGGASGKGGGGSNTSGATTSTTTGGAGTVSTYSGTSVTYGVGGTGGTARGLVTSTNIAGSAGSANTGNGGGGASAKSSSGEVNGGAGGTGLVIVRVASALTITFDSQSGSAVSDGSTVTGGSIATAPTDPTRSNYTFVGWFTATTGGTAITFPYAHGQTANFTLYARWTLNTYAITFNANNGSGSMRNQSFTHGVATNLNANLYTRANYVFHRWATAADGTGTTYNNLAQVTLTAGTTLYAQWTANTYVVTYSYNNATGGNSTATSSFTTGGTAIVLPTPTRTGYTFAGWFSDAGLTSSIGLAGANYSPAGATLSLNAYAKWTAIDYTFTYDGNSADSGSVPTESSKQITQTATVSANTGTLVRAGYTFSGWNTQSNGGGTTYLSGSIFTVQSSNVTLYAKWTANTYTVTYNSNGGTGNAQRTVSSVATYISTDSYTTGGASVALPGVGTLERAGYTFGGWNTSAAGTGTNRLEAATYTTVSDVTLYAKWNPVTYSITYDANTGTGTAPTTGGYTTGQASPYSVLTNTFTKTLNVFGGWNTASDGTGTSYSPGSSITTLSNIVLYAVWIPQYTLHYAINGGTVTSGSLPGDRLYNTGTSIGPVFSSVSRTGYNFGGWSNGSTTVASGGSFIIAADSVLTAIWNPINYVISYESDGGSTAPSSITKQIGQSYTVGAAVSKPGYNFAGWSNGSSVVGAGAGIVMGSSDVTYTAQWVAMIYTISYDWNGGRGTAVSDVNYTFGTTAITLPLVGDRVKDGYTFAGWSESSNGSALSATYIPSQSRTLYALWNIGNFTVTYDAGRGTIANSTVAVQNGGSTVLPLPTRANFVFNGWHTAVTGGSSIGSNGASFTPTASQTIYARWIQSSLYGITDSLSRIGSVVTSSNIANTFSGANSNSSVAVSIPANALPAGTTINFDLVSNSSRATGILSGVNYLVSIALSWLTGDETVPDTAADKPITVTISNSSIKAGAAAYAIVNNVSTLLGTATQDGVITVSITSDPEIVVAATKPTAPTSVAATSNGNQQSVISWSAPSSDGGSAVTGYTVTANTGASCTTSATSCTISSLTNGTAYTFTVTATNTVGTSVASTSASATTASLYAVTFDSKGGTSVTSGSFLTASTVSEPTAPTRTGYSFAGWSATDGGSAEVFPYAPGVTTSITMYARWDALDHVVTFDSKSGSVVADGIFASGGTVTQPTAPTRTGYTFAGWSATDGGIAVTFPYAPGVVTDITLYAKWTVVSQNSSGGSGGGSSTPAPSEPSAPANPVKSNVTLVAPVTVVGDKDAKVLTVEVFVPAAGSSTKPPAIKLDAASEKFIADIKIVEGKLVLTPETGFSGKKTVTVTVTENGAERFIQIPLTVLPEPVTKPVLTPTASNKTIIRWTESPNADAYSVYLNGKKICSTEATSCSVNRVLGPDADIQIISNGGDRTISTKAEADFKQNTPVPITRLVSATITKGTLSRVDTNALDKVISLIKTQGFGTVVISEITTTSKTKALADARLAAIKRYIDAKTGSEKITFEVVPAVSRTYFNNISVKG